MPTTLIDSPVANIGNIARALRKEGADLRLTRDPDAIATAQQLVLPGVGSFGAAMGWLEESGIAGAIRVAAERGAWILGICVGHQLLFERSYEMGVTSGLGLLRGEVRPLEGSLPVPQIGWNALRFDTADLLFEGIDDRTSFYFVNSYAAAGVESEIASGHYGEPFTAAARQDRIFGVQFHPEKSSVAGLRVLRNFLACS